MTKSKPERPLYSKRFLARYGERLTREEIRLVQGYRGLSQPYREMLLQFASGMVLAAGTGRGE